MNELFRRIRYLLNQRRLDAELANDMEFHREMASRQGEPPGLEVRCVFAKKRATHGAGRGLIALPKTFATRPACSASRRALPSRPCSCWR